MIEKILQTIIAALQPQDFVLALWQVGSEAHGYTDAWSDIDIVIIVEDSGATTSGRLKVQMMC